MTCTDVEDLGKYMDECIEANCNFRRATEAECTDLVKCAL